MSSPRPLKLAFDSLESLVESIRPGLSRTYIFAETPEVIPAEIRVRLEIRVAGEGPRIRGVAKVAEDPGSAARTAPGLHLDVIHLDPPSTRFVDSIVSGGVATGRARETSRHGPFEMSHTEPAVVDETQIPASTGEPTAGRLSRLWWPVAFFVLLGIFLLALELISNRDDSRLLTGRDRRAPADEPTPESVPPVAIPSDDQAPDPDPAAAREEVERVVRSWAAAWSLQRAGDYLAIYAESFQAPDLTREAWERERRTRIAAPENIEVQLSELEVELTGPDHASARFHQLYVTDSVRLATRKVLDLERQGDWKIVAERAQR